MTKQTKVDDSFIELTPALQQWADMYNKADKERFEYQLKLAIAEKKLKKNKTYSGILC